MYSFEYSVVAKTSSRHAWEIFANWEKWPSFANIYGDIRWCEGEPWRIGSRMKIELVHPVKTVVDHLIICSEPAREIGWIDRAMGITMGQWVKFEAQGSGSTRVKTWGEVTRSEALVGGRPVKELVASFIRTWYENFRLACEQAPESTG
jgi:hypothetical protein